FNYGRIAGCTAYILTHFHSDHYGGLSRRFDYGKLYCSQVTAALVTSQLGVSYARAHPGARAQTLTLSRPMFVHPLSLDTTHEIDGGIRVTLIDANQCACPVRSVLYAHTSR